MKKRLLSLVMVIALALSLFGCGGKEETKGKESLTSTIDFNETGYPIVNEPLKLKVGVYASASYEGEWDELTWVKALEEASGIDLEFVIYNDGSAMDLMFAGQNFPDILWNVGSSQQIYDAAKGGYIYALDEYMDKYAPNWANYFAKNEESLKKVKAEDGHIYSFPMVREEDYHYNLRDIWQINKTWLDEAGAKVPTTIDEYYNALKAIKANAGKGSIPEDVIPYYVTGVTEHVGGALDVINSYGVRVSSENYLVTVDDDGEVEFNFNNPEIKEPLKFLNKLVNEDLLAKSGFTDDFSAYTAKIMSSTQKIASFHAYYNYTTDTNEYASIGPLDSGNGMKPMMRSLANAIDQNNFTVTKTCKYPEVAVRLANMIAEEEWSVQAAYGMLDNQDSSLYKDAEGNYVARAGLNGYNIYAEVPSFRVACLISEDVYNKIKYDESSDRYQRAQACEGVYAGKTIAQENLYPFITFSEENATEIGELYYDINNYVIQTLDKWAVQGGIDAEWDEYVKQLNSLGLERYLELLQEELDAYNNR